MKTLMRQQHTFDSRLRRFAAALMLALVLLLAGTAAQAAQVTLRWNASPEENIAGYVVHFGTRSGQYDQNIDVGKAQRVTISDLEPGRTYYFAATAYDIYGFSSDVGEELAFTIQNGKRVLAGSNPALNLLVIP